MPKKNDALGFIIALFRKAWETGDVDYEWLMKEGVKQGFLRQEEYDQAKHKGMEDVEEGDMVYVFTERLRHGSEHSE